MNNKNKHLRVSYFSHSFMVGQALHMHNNLNSSSVNCCKLLGKLCIYITNKKRTRQKRLACFSNKLLEYLWLVLVIRSVFRLYFRQFVT